VLNGALLCPILRVCVVRSTTLFGIYIDVLVKSVKRTNIGCKIGTTCTGNFLYADDIILLALSVEALPSLISICESELNFYAWLLM